MKEAKVSDKNGIKCVTQKFPKLVTTAGIITNIWLRCYRLMLYEMGITKGCKALKYAYNLHQQNSCNPNKFTLKFTFVVTLGSKLFGGLYANQRDPMQSARGNFQGIAFVGNTRGYFATHEGPTSISSSKPFL